MLVRLHVRDFAIIDALQVEFEPGFNALTGETGAGKSILLSALRLLLGDRAQSDLIREGADVAVVEGLFMLPEQGRTRAQLEAYALPLEEEGLLIRRVVNRSGRNKIFVNGAMATLGMLQDVTRELVDISGQHDHVSLVRPEVHLELLDAYGQLEKERAQVAAAYGQLSRAASAYEQLLRGAAELAQQREFMAFQLEELERLSPRSGELEELEAEHRQLASSEAIERAALQAESLLYSEEGSASERVAQAIHGLEELREAEPEFAGALPQLQECAAILEDVGATLGRVGRSVSHDPQRLADIEERLAHWRRLLRKYGGSEDALLNRYHELREALGEGQDAETQRSAHAQAVRDTYRQWTQKALKLTQGRRKAARGFQRSVETELHGLGMGSAKIEVAFEAIGASGGRDPATLLEAGEAPLSGVNVRGAERVTFLMSSNAGEKARGLSRVASGGELSRLMLAIKRVCAQSDPVGCYVFDEIDTGVGGRLASTIGEKLDEVARDRQVLCITHLPQVASYARAQFRVEKLEEDGRTHSRVRRLEGKERVAELAEMLGGDAKKSQALARELLSRSR